jgi:NAD(P)H-dependent flavin oxidoreductase YrpB (nitropropane dioxygenase family)
MSIPQITNLDDLERSLREQIDVCLDLTSSTVAMNVPVGRDTTGKVLAGTEAILRFVFAARRSDSAVERQLRVLTTSAGFPGEFREQIRDAGLVHMHKVGAPRHAEKAAAAGVDVVIASGFEMGGHTLAIPISTMVLGPEVLRRIEAPVVLSGGFKDGRGLAAALAMGAAGIAMGTRFLATAENDWHPMFIQRILDAHIEDSVVLPGMYGPARFLRSAGTDRLQQIVERREMAEEELSSWKEMAVKAAQRDGDVENGLVPAGQVAGFIDDRPPVADLLKRIVAEAEERLSACAAFIGRHAQ